MVPRKAKNSPRGAKSLKAEPLGESNATSRGPKGGPGGPRGARKGPTGTPKVPTWSQKGPDWSPEGVQNDPKMALKTCLKFGRFPRSILGAFLVDFKVDYDVKNTRKQWRGHQNQGFRTLSPDIVLDPMLGRFGVKMWVIFGPKIDPKSFQK